MSMEQNQLTRDLYAAGYTREDHPSFVYWSDWQNFGYLFEALLKFTWETPCGLLVDGKSDLGRGLACSDASFQGIDYCPENDNPLLRCPYERKDCPHSISGFPVPLCPCHTTGKRYSFEQSAEKVETERSERQHRQYDDLPLMLSVAEVAAVLGISRAGAYELARSSGFPALKIGSRIVVPKDKFLAWIDANSGSKNAPL